MGIVTTFKIYKQLKEDYDCTFGFHKPKTAISVSNCYYADFSQKSWNSIRKEKISTNQTQTTIKQINQ